MPQVVKGTFASGQSVNLGLVSDALVIPSDPNRILGTGGARRPAGFAYDATNAMNTFRLSNNAAMTIGNANFARLPA